MQAPNRTGQPNLSAGDRVRARFFKADVFQRPAQYVIGKGGRNTVIGPGSRNLDLSFSKQFSLTEKISLQLRAEMFNILNHPNWGSPDTTLGTSSFGVISSNSNLRRDIQFGLKLCG